MSKHKVVVRLTGYFVPQNEETLLTLRRQRRDIEKEFAALVKKNNMLEDMDAELLVDGDDAWNGKED